MIYMVFSWILFKFAYEFPCGLQAVFYHAGLLDKTPIVTGNMKGIIKGLEFPHKFTIMHDKMFP